MLSLFYWGRDIAVVLEEKQVLFKKQILVALKEWCGIEVEVGSIGFGILRFEFEIIWLSYF